MANRKTPISAVAGPRQSATKAVNGSADLSSSKARSQIEKIPSPARYGLLVLSSLVLSSVLFTVTASVTVGDLSFVSKHLETWWEASGLIAWRAVELGLAWILGFDGRDVAEFTLLTHVPTFFLLLHFYGVRPTTIATSFFIDIVSMTVPFVLLRGTNSVHSLSSSRSASVSNRGILQDRLIALYTSVAAAAIYTVCLYLSFSTWLPTHLVIHFEDLPDIRPVHAGPAGLPSVFLSLLFEGYAAYDLLFVSSTGWSAEETSVKKPSGSNRHGEYLITSMYNRTWGRLSPKSRILISRTLILAVMTLLNTVVQVSGTVKGVSVEGSAGWGLVWSTAVLMIGSTFAWIEAVPGV